MSLYNPSPIHTFYKKVKNNIPFIFPQKKSFLKDFHKKLSDFATNRSDLTFEDLVSEFGEPTIIVDNLIKATSPASIHRSLFLKPLFKFLLFALYIVVILFYIEVYKFSTDFPLVQEIHIEQQSFELFPFSG